MQQLIAHLDMDAFFASINEERGDSQFTDLGIDLVGRNLYYLFSLIN